MQRPNEKQQRLSSWAINYCVTCNVKHILSSIFSKVNILPKTCRPISYNLYIKANNKFWKQNQVSHNKEYNRVNLTTEKACSVKVGGDPQSPVLSFLTAELPLTHPLNDSISSSRFVFFVVVSVGVIIVPNIAVALCKIKTAPSMRYVRRYLISNKTLVYLIKA